MAFIIFKDKGVEPAPILNVMKMAYDNGNDKGFGIYVKGLQPWNASGYGRKVIGNVDNIIRIVHDLHITKEDLVIICLGDRSDVSLQLSNQFNNVQPFHKEFGEFGFTSTNAFTNYVFAVDGDSMPYSTYQTTYYSTRSWWARLYLENIAVGATYRSDNLKGIPTVQPEVNAKLKIVMVSPTNFYIHNKQLFTEVNGLLVSNSSYQKKSDLKVIHTGIPFIQPSQKQLDFSNIDEDVEEMMVNPYKHVMDTLDDDDGYTEYAVEAESVPQVADNGVEYASKKVGIYRSCYDFDIEKLSHISRSAKTFYTEDTQRQWPLSARDKFILIAIDTESQAHLCNVDTGEMRKIRFWSLKTDFDRYLAKPLHNDSG